MRRRLKRRDVETRLLVVGDGESGDRGLRRPQGGERLACVVRAPQPARTCAATVTGGVEAIEVCGDEGHLCVIGRGQQASTAERVERGAVVVRREQPGVGSDEQRPDVPDGRERAGGELQRHGAGDRRVELFPSRSRIQALIQGQRSSRCLRVAARNQPDRGVDGLHREGADAETGKG